MESSPTATVKPASVRAPVQPCTGTPMIAYTSATMPRLESTPPRRSSRRGTGARDSGTTSAIPTSAAATSGRLIAKTDCQPKRRSSSPPTIGPAANPTIEIAPHVAIAFGRSSSVNTFVRMASVAGTMAAPPTPVAQRAAISSAGDVASIAHNEASPKSATPAVSALRRPYRSLSVPLVSRSPAKTSE